jgi:organic radical activating enzyme
MNARRLHIPYAEFYITNVCNLACQGCNRFNDVKFRGYQKWADYADVYTQWSSQVSVGSLAILGGEPMLNPTFYQWADGITNLWPRTLVRIIANGFYLNKTQGLYDLLCSKPNLKLWIGIHNKLHKKMIFDQVQRFLAPPLTKEFDDSVPYQHKLYVKDSNGISVIIEHNWWFHQGSIIKTQNGSTLHQSDPYKAHNICNMKTCHTFSKGKLYKCGVVAVLPEYHEQFNLELTPEDQDLLSSYTPLSAKDQFDQKKLFIESLSSPIAQCKFCPESYNGQQIWSQEKKLTFHRKAQ